MSEHSGFKFELRQKVFITISGEQGVVVARCEYVNRESTYEVRYVRKNGTATQVIWSESALSAV